MTIENSVFVAGADAGSGHIFTSTGPSNGALIGNTFEAVDGSYSMQGTAGSGWRIKNNFFSQPVAMSFGGSSVFCGNTGSISASWQGAC